MPFRKRMMKDTRIPLLLMLLSICSKVEARELTRLRGQHHERKLENNLQEEKAVIEVQSTKPEEEVSNKELLNCLSDDLLTKPDTQYSRFDLKDCRPNLASSFISRLGIGEKKSGTDALQELLSCVGTSMGCLVGGGQPETLTAPVILEEPRTRKGPGGTVITIIEEEPLVRKGGQEIPVIHPYADLLNCFSSGLDGDQGSIDFSFNAFNCVSASSTTVEGMMTCIGKSVGCKLPKKDKDEQGDKNTSEAGVDGGEASEETNGISIQVAPQLALPSGTARRGNPDDP